MTTNTRLPDDVRRRVTKVIRRISKNTRTKQRRDEIWVFVESEHFFLRVERMIRDLELTMPPADDRPPEPVRQQYRSILVDWMYQRFLSLTGGYDQPTVFASLANPVLEALKLAGISKPDKDRLKALHFVGRLDLESSKWLHEVDARLIQSPRGSAKSRETQQLRNTQRNVERDAKIRQLRQKGGCTRKLAERFGLSEQRIRAIVRNKKN